ncbi:hypothetical protein F4801DRAFT_578756 [Xylaria longipes]|nr:hypothetical protein F4801DRAFT_578756 [Xylaria longipes]
MPHATFSSTLTLGSSSTPSYPRELDIADTSNSGTSSSSSSSTSTSTSTSASASTPSSGPSTGGTDRPLMSYSYPISSNWQRDYGNNNGRQSQARGAWSTQGNAGSSS